MTNSGESESLMKMPVKIFISASVCTPTVNFTFQFSVIFVMKFRSFSDILYTFKNSIIYVCGTI